MRNFNSLNLDFNINVFFKLRWYAAKFYKKMFSKRNSSASLKNQETTQEFQYLEFLVLRHQIRLL